VNEPSQRVAVQEESNLQSGTGGGIGTKWYGVSAVYKAIHVGARRRRHLWERIIFVIQAASEPAADEIALQVARDKEREYVGGGGDVISWVLQEVEKVEEILDAEIREGTEVLWEFFERVDKRTQSGDERTSAV